MYPTALDISEDPSEISMPPVYSQPLTPHIDEINVLQLHSQAFHPPAPCNVVSEFNWFSCAVLTTPDYIQVGFATYGPWQYATTKLPLRQQVWEFRKPELEFYQQLFVRHQLKLRL